jgi:hypothetical protein
MLYVMLLIPYLTTGWIGNVVSYQLISLWSHPVTKKLRNSNSPLHHSEATYLKHTLRHQHASDSCKPSLAP